MYGPEAIRRICEPLAHERDDARCDELIAQLRLIVEEDREELSDRLQLLAGRLLQDDSRTRRDILERGHRPVRGLRQGLTIVVHANLSERQASQD